MIEQHSSPLRLVRGIVWGKSECTCLQNESWTRHWLTAFSSLAWAEMRSILARIVWHFDMELCDESKERWENQKLFTLWEKPPLMVQLTRRGKAAG